MATNSPITLEQGLALHPNVAYAPNKTMNKTLREGSKVIPTTQFHSVSLEKIKKFYTIPNAERLRSIYSRLPNLWTISHGFDGVVERAMLDDRLVKFKSKKPEYFSEHYQKVTAKLVELDKCEKELQTVIADFKEAVNIFYESERRFSK